MTEQPEETPPLEEVLSERLLEPCPACGAVMDVSDIVPYTEVNCPGCGQAMRVRQQVNHFTIVGHLGEGGMGSVFKAIDTQLNRYVALKILKKECSANAEEREKLAIEARMTASINHPHVVKVFDFGQDHGQFYIAMEMVEKGSLDQLMAIQRRLPEAQVLEVGMQISMGLEAALEKGLIHRDIKPGNILFADAHTTKLVDFGLAIVMDEEAQVRGEIWGTPYYIAPEKLDNQPEDYRSDIYSLGGTLFHAVAGRPPYEAESASMVALKQLKSQQVSLQSFAPEVSSETAYVINRMMAKHPDDRYGSYQELTSHLAYAREKLLERTRKPIQPKQRVVLETAETRKVSAFLSLGLLVFVILAGVGIYLMRDKIFPGSFAVVTSEKSGMSAEEAQSLLVAAVGTLAGGDVDGAAQEFSALVTNAATPQPQKNWAILNGALADILAGNPDRAVASLRTIKDLYSTESDDLALANFFVESARVVSQGKVIAGSTRSLYDSREDAFALLLFGIWNWEAKGAFEDAGDLLQNFVRSKPAQEWVDEYKPLAERYVADFKLLKPIEAALPQAATPEARKALLARVETARGSIQTGTKIAVRLDEIAKDLSSPPKP